MKNQEFLIFRFYQYRPLRSRYVNFFVQLQSLFPIQYLIFKLIYVLMSVQKSLFRCYRTGAAKFFLGTKRGETTVILKYATNAALISSEIIEVKINFDFFNFDLKLFN